MISRVFVLLSLLGLLAPAALAQDSPKPQEFRPGDRVMLRVEGEKQLTDTFTVVAGPAIELPGFGAVPLAGVARGDVEAYLAERIGRFLKRADVRARALVRLSIVGEVEKPGFYAVPADQVLTDAFMVSGGPTREAKVQAVRIDRDGSPLWDGNRLRQGIASGYTIDQFGLRDGDQIVFPRLPRGRTLAIVGIVMAIPTSLVAVIMLSRF
jgi:polysaccharide export outer membrane protein